VETSGGKEWELVEETQLKYTGQVGDVTCTSGVQTEIEL
jgi:hypothetical protein